LIVSCGGDGAIAVYKEEQPATNPTGNDVDMNGTAGAAGSVETKWTLVALVESAHDEFEINHVCWAARRDNARRFEGEEVIVSTGDEGDVRVWTLPDGVAF